MLDDRSVIRLMYADTPNQYTVLYKVGSAQHSHGNDSEHTVTTKPLVYSLSRKFQLLCEMSRVDLAEQRRSVRADVGVSTKSDHQSDGAQAANIHSP